MSEQSKKQKMSEKECPNSKKAKSGSNDELVKLLLGKYRIKEI